MPWYAFAFSSAILLAFAAVLEKKILFKEHATSFAATFAALNGLFGLILLPYVEFGVLSGRVVFLIYSAAVVDSLAFLFFIKGLRHLEVSYVAPMMAIGPAITAILAFFLLGETLVINQALGIGLLALGAIILQLRVTTSPFSARVLFPPAKYMHAVIISLALYGAGSIFDRLILAHYGIPPETFVFFGNIFIAINLLLVAILFYNGFADIRLVVRRSWIAVFFVGILMLGQRLAEVHAISIASVGLVVALKRTSALFTAFLGGELFNEDHFWLLVVAAIIMVAGAAFVVF